MSTLSPVRNPIDAILEDITRVTVRRAIEPMFANQKVPGRTDMRRFRRQLRRIYGKTAGRHL